MLRNSDSFFFGSIFSIFFFYFLFSFSEKTIFSNIHKFGTEAIMESDL